MSNDSLPDPKAGPVAPVPATHSPSQPMAADSNRWRLQFGILEFHGLLFAIASYFWVLSRLFDEGGRRRPFGSLTTEKRVSAFLIACLFSFSGTYLAARLATSRGIQIWWQRILLQLAMIFVVVPLLVAAFWIIIGGCCLLLNG